MKWCTTGKSRKTWTKQMYF